MLFLQISNHLELIKPNPKDEVEKQKKDSELASAVFGADVDLVGGSAQIENFMGLSDIEHCGKMRALEKLLLSWTSHSDKILLFSYSVRYRSFLKLFKPLYEGSVCEIQQDWAEFPIGFIEWAIYLYRTHLSTYLAQPEYCGGWGRISVGLFFFLQSNMLIDGI